MTTVEVKKQNVPKLRFPGFEGEWAEKKLGELGPVSMCKRVFKDETTTSGAVPFFKIGTFGAKPDAFISSRMFEDYKSKYSYPNKGDILLSAAGTIGRLVVYDGEPAYFQDSNIVWIANDERSVSNSFLYHCYSKVNWTTEDTTIARLYNDNLKSIAISAPSLSEQQRIAAFLGAVDDKITQLQKKKALLEDYKKGCMQELFSRELRFKDDTGNAFPNWDKQPFGNLVERVNERFNPVSESTNPILIELENIEGGTGRLVGQSDLAEQKSLKTVFKANDVLFGKLRPYLRKFAWPDFDGVCSSEIWALRSSSISHGFLYQLIQTPYFNQLANMSTGSKMPRADWATIADSDFEFPALAEQQKIADFLSALDIKIQLITNEIEHAQTFKKGLLQQMFV